MEVLKKWRNLCDLSKKREQTLLQLLRHPDATIEQIDEARKVYSAAYKRITQMQQQLTAASQAGKIYNSPRVALFFKHSTHTLTN